jgi:hypothetical protein
MGVEYEKSIQYSNRETVMEDTTWRPRRRWEDNINIDHEDIVWKNVGWICLPQETTGRQLWTQ